MEFLKRYSRLSTAISQPFLEWLSMVPYCDGNYSYLTIEKILEDIHRAFQSNSWRYTCTLQKGMYNLLSPFQIVSSFGKSTYIGLAMYRFSKITYCLERRDYIIWLVHHIKTIKDSTTTCICASVTPTRLPHLMNLCSSSHTTRCAAAISTSIGWHHNLNRFLPLQPEHLVSIAAIHHHHPTLV